MLYILGGAPRAGKTLMSKKALLEKRIPYFPLDGLVGALSYAMPELHISHDESFVDKSERLWKINKYLLGFFAANGETYLVEGDSILPAQAREAIDEHKDVRACFVGYPGLSPEEKLKLIRGFPAGIKDWTEKYSDAELLPTLRRAVEYSVYLKNECGKYGIPFFDLSEGFQEGFDAAYQYLVR